MTDVLYNNKGKTVAIQQPEHLPWLGFFDKMAKCNLYVYLDNVQFKKRYFENRNRILINGSEVWLTIPVITKGRYHQRIQDVVIDNGKRWRRKYLGMLRIAYAKSPYFRGYFKAIEDIIQGDFENLVDLNIALVEWSRKKLGISTPTVRASKIRDYEEKGSSLILAICRDLGAGTYISGPDGRNYLDLCAFEKEGIKVVYHDYEHPVYHQACLNFISHMSTVDFLFNEGAKRLQESS